MGGAWSGGVARAVAGGVAWSGGVVWAGGGAYQAVDGAVRQEAGRSRLFQQRTLRERATEHWKRETRRVNTWSPDPPQAALSAPLVQV